MSALDDFFRSILQDPTVRGAITALNPGAQASQPTPAVADQSAQITPQTAIPLEKKALTMPTRVKENGAISASPIGSFTQHAIEGGNMDEPNTLQGNAAAAGDMVNSIPMALGAGNPEAAISDIGLAPVAADQGLTDLSKTLETAKMQPMGLQAGFLKPDEFINPTKAEPAPGPILDAKGEPVPPSVSPDSRTQINVAPKGEEPNLVPGNPTVPQYAQEPPTGSATLSDADVQPGEPGQAPAKPPFNPNGYQKPQNPMLPSAKASQSDNMRYQSVFQVPSAVVSKMAIKPEQVVNTLINDGVTNVSLDDLEHTAGEVTGGSGAMANINNYLLSKVPKMVSYTDAANEADSGLSTTLEGEPKGLIAQVKREVGAAFRPVHYENTPAEMPNNTAWASDLFNVSQNLGDTANLMEKRSLDVNGDLKNPEYGRAADAVLQIKNKIDAVIDEATKDDYQAYKQDPYVQSQLQRVPGPLAQRFLDSANRFKDGQTIQAPYVQLSKILRYTKDKKLAPFTQAIDESRGKLPSVKAQETATNIATGITNPFKGIPQIIGKTAGKIASQYNPTAEDIDRQLTTPANTTTAESSAQTAFYPKGGIPQIKGKPLGPKMKAAGLLGLVGIGVTAGYVGSKINEGATNAEGDQQTGPNQNQHDGTISQYNKPVNWNTLPTDTTKLTPDQSGLYSAPSPAMIVGKDGKPLATMDDNSFNAIAEQASDISNKFNLKVQADFQKAKIANTQYHQLMDNYTTYVQLNNQISNAMSDLQGAPPNILQQAKTIQGLQTIFNGKYKKAAEALQILNQVYPTDVSGIFGSADMNAVDGTFSAMSQDLTGKYIAKINAFTGNLPAASGATGGLPAPSNNGLQTLPSAGDDYTQHGTPQPFVY